MLLFSKNYHQPGTSPGTLRDTETTTGSVIHWTQYTHDFFQEHIQSDALADCPEPNARYNLWVHIQGRPSVEVMRALGTHFGLHHLALEDVLNRGQRAKLEEYPQQLFLVMHLPKVNGHSQLHAQQVSLFIGQHFVVSFYEPKEDPFHPVRERLRNSVGRIRSRHHDYLLFALLDVIVDTGFPTLENYGEWIETLEEELLNQPGTELLGSIHQVRRDLLLLRRMLWPARDVLNQLQRQDCPCIQAETQIYLRDCHDHSVQILDLLESYREMSNGMLEVYLSSLSNRLNQSMRVLTLIATLFIPLTFIVGIYGMNFGNNTESSWAMPELRWEYGYPAVWILMLAVTLVMLIMFRRNKWL